MITLDGTLKDALRAEEIEGLIEQGAPDDEYDSEAREIARAANRLGKKLNEQGFIAIIALTWAKRFNLSPDDIALRMAAFQKVAVKALRQKM